MGTERFRAILAAASAVVIGALALGVLRGSGPIRATSRGDPAQVSLPVRVLPTRHGFQGRTFGYPRSVLIRLPAGAADRLEAYGVAETVLLAPKGWTGEGTVGANGTLEAELRPRGTASGTPAGRIVFRRVAGCVCCAWLEAGRYFESIRNHWRPECGPLPEPVPRLRIRFLGPGLILYQLPDTERGLAVQGVAYTSLVPEVRQQDTPPRFERLEVQLPRRWQDLAAVILQERIDRLGE